MQHRQQLGSVLVLALVLMSHSAAARPFWGNLGTDAVTNPLSALQTAIQGSQLRRLFTVFEGDQAPSTPRQAAVDDDSSSLAAYGLPAGEYGFAPGAYGVLNEAGPSGYGLGYGVNEAGPSGYGLTYGSLNEAGPAGVYGLAYGGADLQAAIERSDNALRSLLAPMLDYSSDLDSNRREQKQQQRAQAVVQAGASWSAGPDAIELGAARAATAAAIASLDGDEEVMMVQPLQALTR